MKLLKRKNKAEDNPQDKTDKSHKEFKIRTGVRKKLFIFITILVLSLLLTIYFITTRDTKIALIEELKKKGGVIAEEKAKSAFTKVFERVTSTPGMTIDRITNQEYTELFLELIRKELHPRDVIYSYIISKKGVVFIHSEDPDRSQAEKYAGKMFPFPKGLYPYRYIFLVKNHIRAYIDEKSINAFDLKEEKFIPIIKETFYLNLKNKITINGQPITLDKFIPLALTAFRVFKSEREELLKFLVNVRSDLSNLRSRFRDNPDIKTLISSFRKRLNIMISERVFTNDTLKAFAQEILQKVKDKPLKTRGPFLGIISSIKNFFAGYIVQSYNRQVGNDTEQILDISYPITQRIVGNELKRFVGEIHIGISLRGVHYTIRDSERKMQWIAFLDILIGLVITFFLASYFVHPIKKIVGAMRQVGAGDLDQEVKIRNKDEIGLLATNFNDMVGGLREKEKIRSAMNKAVSKEIAEKMLEGDIKLGGEKVAVTMLFSDIRGFTAMSEKMQPEEVIVMLNEYMTEMSKIIDKHRGVIDKFVGDEIMAIYGAPVPVTNEAGEHIDAYLAVKSAVIMIKTLKELNKIRVERGQHEIFIGIGLNTGEVVAGNMGSENRLNYTVLGDNVNLAARLCDKAERMMVLVSESTYEKVMDHVVAKKQPPLKVKGKEKPLNVYSIIDFKE